MSHDHAEIELAAAAIDFELTPSERARLEKAVTDCPVCAQAAAAYRRQGTLLAALPVVDASPAVRRHVERAVGLRPQRTPWTWAMLAAALLGLLVTSALVVGAIDQNRRNRLVDVAPTPVPSESPVPSAPPTDVPPDVVALDPPSGELADVGPPLAHDSLALVVTDNLRVRSAPFVGDLSVRYKRLLQPDDRLFVVDGPVIAQNYEWYQVKAWRPRQPSASWPVGWVARAGHDGEVWIRASTRTCPSEPVDIAALLELAPAERVACFREAPMEVRAVVAEGASDACDAARDGCATGPEWLAAAPLIAGASTSQSGAAGAMSISLDPGGRATAADLVEAGVVRLRGAFDHADSALCRPDPAKVGRDGPLSPIEAVLQCRSRFVVADAVVEPFPRRQSVPAITVSDRLRVRSLPQISDASIRYEPLLPLGSRLWVLDGPNLGGGYAWYHVLAPISGSGGAVTKWLTGWVAMAGLDGERWVEATSLDCPPAGTPLTPRDLAALRQRPIDGGPLTCFGGSEIQVDGTVSVACPRGQAGASTADWLLDGSGRWLDIVQDDRTLRARIDPARPIDLPCAATPAGQFRVTGHYDDPAATGCTPAADMPAGTDRLVAVYLCRTSFVATGVEPLGPPSTLPPPRGG
jgi:hypothetical protein